MFIPLSSSLLIELSKGWTVILLDTSSSNSIVLFWWTRHGYRKLGDR
ncbi:unnamed protein product [Linum tenue]|uniref:Uncharacterized protein n=1 Tax=Linum tenue TaxID=586396 RepID=A0AAV0QFI2_9ROSI|nr:unnamed protein product [Linum tenue]